MTRLKEIFKVKIKPIASGMGVPVDWLKEDLRRLTIAGPLPHAKEVSAEYHNVLLKVYPQSLLDPLLLYHTPAQLLIEARYWALCASDRPKEYSTPAKPKHQDKMIDYSKWTSVFAHYAWREGYYTPTKADWIDFKKATR